MIHISNIGVFLMNLIFFAKSKTCFDRSFSTKAKNLKQLTNVHFQKFQFQSLTLSICGFMIGNKSYPCSHKFNSSPVLSAISINFRISQHFLPQYIRLKKSKKMYRRNL